MLDVSVRREKKSKYYRGSRVCGWGRTGQHRRSGRKGGRGHAGYHKHYWTWVVKYAPDWFGKHGFTRPPSIVPQYRGINVGQLDEVAEELLKKGVAKEEDGKIRINIVKLGFNKLLGGGRVTKPLIVETIKATEEAVRKIEEAGGKVVILGGA